MHLIVTFGTESDQVLLSVISGLAAQLDVVNVKILLAATVLATPAIPLQHLPTQFSVNFPIKLDTMVLAG